jgi:hypothetical protein
VEHFVGQSEEARLARVGVLSQQSIGSDVKVTLEIEATIPGGASDHVVRTVTENSRQLGFRDFGFEEE